MKSRSRELRNVNPPCRTGLLCDDSLMKSRARELRNRDFFVMSDTFYILNEVLS